MAGSPGALSVIPAVGSCVWKPETFLHENDTKNSVIVRFLVSQIVLSNQRQQFSKLSLVIGLCTVTAHSGIFFILCSIAMLIKYFSPLGNVWTLLLVHYCFSSLLLYSKHCPQPLDCCPQSIYFSWPVLLYIHCTHSFIGFILMCGEGNKGRMVKRETMPPWKLHPWKYCPRSIILEIEGMQNLLLIQSRNVISK